MPTTATTPDTTPDPAIETKKPKDASASAKVRDSASRAKTKMGETARETSSAAKKRPYTAAAVVTGTLAALGGAAFGIFKLTGKKEKEAEPNKPKPPKVKHSAM